MAMREGLMCGMSGISGMFSPDLLFLPPANSRAMGGFIPLIPHPVGETASRHQGSNLLTDTQIASYCAAWVTFFCEVRHLAVSAIYACLIRYSMAGRWCTGANITTRGTSGA